MPALTPSVGRLGNVWRSWSGSFVHDGVGWVEPELVYAFHDGAWQVVWARVPADPVSVTATVTAAGQVTIDWTADDPEAVTSYEVSRADGSIVGSVAAGVYTLVDTAARALTGSYRVKARIGVTAGAGTLSNSLSLAAAPTGVTRTLSNVGVDTNVQVDWGAVPVATGYQVFRPGGTSPIATLGAGTLTYTDTNPQPGTGSYTVKAVVNSTTGAAGASASTTYAGTPTSLNAGTVTGGDNVPLTWSLAAAGTHDDVQVLRGGSVLATLGAGTTSYTDTNAREGTVETYTVRTRISANAGSQSSSDTAAIAANEPVSVTLVATATLGQLTLSWGHPAGDRTGYEVQYSDNGSSWSGSSDDVSPSSHTFTGGSGTRYMRVRTLSDGGVSSWVERNTTPLWDNTPPPDASITGWKPESTYGRMVLRFTIAGSGATTQYKVQRNVNSAGWTDVTGWVNTSPGANEVEVVGTWAAGVTIQARVQVRDTYQNTSTGSAVTYTLTASPVTVFALASGSWQGGVWDALGDQRPRQGYFSTPTLMYVGAWFYGTAIASACNADGGVGNGGNLTVVSITATIPRLTGVGGAGAVTPLVWTHDRTSGGGSVPTFDNGVTFPGVAPGGSVEAALSTAGKNDLVSGAARGIGLFANGSAYYMACPSEAENIFSGLIRINHLG